MKRKRFMPYLNVIFTLLLMVNLFTPIADAVTIQSNDDWITVGEAIELGTDGGDQKVKGYVVGYVLSKDNVTTDPSRFNGDTNVAIADSPDETDTDKMVYVQIPNRDKMREEFGLQSNPDNLGKEILASGTLGEYFKPHLGLLNVLEISFADDAGGTQPDPEPLEIIPIADAHAQGTGEVKVKGVVTAKLKNTIHIQDETGGIAVRPTTLDVQLGDEIVLQGNLQDFRTLLQVDGAVLLEKTGSPGVPEAIVLSAEELTKANQSKLARVQKVTIVDVNDGGTWANYGAVDENGVEFLVRDENNDLNLTVGTSYDAITGIVSHFDGDAQIIPRNNVDIIVDESVVQSVYARPDAGVVPSGTEVTLATNTQGARILYTLDDTDPSTNGIEYTKPIVLEESSTIRAIGVKDGLTPSGVSLFEYVVYDADAGIQIHDIQGEGHLSPMIGHLVSGVEGVVIYKYDIR